ncbi:hypothetical protein psal_cds_369 [Pandoravirus salinus]|uniref:Uncharacterized protein n=1 Tax=Pandoravirus salinus TaxID=1349410 RepID=S4W0X2_9VIRU|nr:hypothetical protein psal_cds_369 [Pandoravirus salinus]AGO84037.1 hypothetical protein psal_cds_369 [Pandoravirus salinus]
MAEHARATPRTHAQGRTALPPAPPPAFGLVSMSSSSSSTPRQPPDLNVGSAASQSHPAQSLVSHQHQPQQHAQHPLVAARVEIAALAASVNAAILGMQAAVDGLMARLERVEKRMCEEARRALESQRVVADHVESLWRAIDGSREATNWCWARITPAAEGVARMRVRLVGHNLQQHQPRHTRDTPSGADATAAAAASEPALAVRLGDGAWLCVRYPMVHAPDDAGARCVWMRTTLVDEADATMRPYWVKAYDLDAQVAFLADFTNVPPCFDAEPFDQETNSGGGSDVVDTDTDNDDERADGRVAGARSADATPDQKVSVGDGSCDSGSDSHSDDDNSAGRRAHTDTVPPPILRDGPQPNAVARAHDDDDDTPSTDDGSP